MKLTTSDHLDSKTEKSLIKVWMKGESYSWDYNSQIDLVLTERFEPDLTKEEAESLFEILKLILWGEKAAWIISSQMAMEVDNIEIAAALTSQARDEARHFMAIKTYMKRLEEKFFLDVDWAASKTMLTGFSQILEADSLGKKVAGMNLMVEPVAMAVFASLISSTKVPVLAELLRLFTEDEARHIAIGTIYFPHILTKMTFWEKVKLGIFQTNILWSEIKGLNELKQHFETLGIKPRYLFNAAKRKQIALLQEVVPRWKGQEVILDMINRALESEYQRIF